MTFSLTSTTPWTKYWGYRRWNPSFEKFSLFQKSVSCSLSSNHDRNALGYFGHCILSLSPIQLDHVYYRCWCFTVSHIYSVSALCVTRLNPNDFKGSYLCHIQGRTHEVSFSQVTGHWFFLKSLASKLSMYLKEIFPYHFNFPGFCFMSVPWEGLTPASHQSLAFFHLFTHFLLWTDCVTNMFTSWTDDFTLLPLFIRASYTANTAFRWTSKGFCAEWLQDPRDQGEYAFSQTVYQGLIYNCPVIWGKEVSVLMRLMRLKWTAVFSHSVIPDCGLSCWQYWRCIRKLTITMNHSSFANHVSNSSSFPLLLSPTAHYKSESD